MRLCMWLVPLVLVTVLSTGCDSVPSGKTGTPVQVAIDARVTHQVMEGFGSSQRLFDDPHVIGGPGTGEETYDRTKSLVITTAEQDEILERLYGDLGLTRVRAAIYPVELQPVKGSQFFFEWKRNDGFFDYVTRAKARGLTTWWLSPVNLEPWMTEANPEDYVEWAMVVIRRWRDHGLELPYYSIMNEPGYKRSGIWSGKYIRNVIKLLGPQLQAEGFNTKLVIPDDLNATQAYHRSKVVLADLEARKYVAALAFHLYDEPLSQAIKMKKLSERYRLPLWMTEYSQDNPLTWANTMHDLISNYNVSAVDYMFAFFGGEDDGGLPITLKHNGTRYLGYKLNKHYYVIGQFSRFVKPGSQRIQANSTNSAIKATAYKDGQKLVIVAINNGNTEKTVQFSLNGVSSIKDVRPIRTSRTEDWAVLEPVPVIESVFTTTLSPVSITTFTTDSPGPLTN
jgi:O-glycosyl hydrolase